MMGERGQQISPNAAFQSGNFRLLKIFSRQIVCRSNLISGSLQGSGPLRRQGHYDNSNVSMLMIGDRKRMSVLRQGFSIIPCRTWLSICLDLHQRNK
jgi:hypothetical protein